MALCALLRAFPVTLALASLSHTKHFQTSWLCWHHMIPIDIILNYQYIPPCKCCIRITTTHSPNLNANRSCDYVLLILIDILIAKETEDLLILDVLVFLFRILPLPIQPGWTCCVKGEWVDWTWAKPKVEFRVLLNWAADFWSLPTTLLAIMTPSCSWSSSRLHMFQKIQAKEQDDF